MTEKTAPLVFLVAAEASSDAIGARLMAGLTQRTDGAVRFAGVGGDGMARQGLTTLFPMDDLSLIGMTELVPHLPNLWRRLRQTTRTIREARPDLILCIDGSRFARALAGRLHGHGIPIVQYKAPQAWAYASWRAKSMRRFDHVLTILPFEQEFYARYGVRTAYVGHPALDGGADRGNGPRFRQGNDVAPDEPLLCLLPGSRRSEIAWSLDDFAATLAYLGAVKPDLRVVVPTVPTVAEAVRAGVARWPIPPIVVDTAAERNDAFAASDAALSVSGTVTVELAMAGVPMAVCYRLKPATAWVARRLAQVEHLSVVNLLLGRAAVPELLQERCRPELLAGMMIRLLREPDLRASVTAACEEAIDRLRPPGGQTPTEAALGVIVDLLGQPVESRPALSPEPRALARSGSGR